MSNLNYTLMDELLTTITGVDDMVTFLDNHIEKYIDYLINDENFCGGLEASNEIYNLRQLRDAIQSCKNV